jgi:hypothetical protein
MDSTLVVLIAVQDEELAMRGAFHEELIAWDWKTGVLLGRCKLGDTLTRSSIALLTPTAVAVTMPAVIGPTLREMFGGVPGFMDNQNPVYIHPPSIDIMTFIHDPSKSPPSRTGPLPRIEAHKDAPKIELVVSLLLPRMRSGSMMAQMHMRPDPAFPPPPSNQASLGARPFTQDPRRGVIVIELTMDDDRLVMPMRVRPEFFEMFILRETLVQMAEEGEARLYDIWEQKAAKRAARRAEREARGESSPRTPSRSSTPSDQRVQLTLDTSSPSPPPYSRASSPASPGTPTSRSSSSRGNTRRTYSDKPRRKPTTASPARTFEWDEWGERSTRVMKPTQLMRRLWVCPAFHARSAPWRHRHRADDG